MTVDPLGPLTCSEFIGEATTCGQPVDTDGRCPRHGDRLRPRVTADETPTAAIPLGPRRLATPPPVEPVELSGSHKAIGSAVAAQFAAQDRLDPHRPTLADLIAYAVAGVERRTSEDCRQRIVGLAEQREALARSRVQVAQSRIAEGNLAAASAELSWAANLDDQAAAVRTLLS